VGTISGHAHGTSITSRRTHCGWGQIEGVGFGQDALDVVFVMVGQDMGISADASIGELSRLLDVR